VTEPIRVLLADDQRVVRDGLVLLLGLLPQIEVVEATRRPREREPGVKVIVLTTYADDRSVIDALRAGARGYLTKDAGADESGDAVGAGETAGTGGSGPADPPGEATVAGRRVTDEKTPPD
jgi:DNA-binding NarL/FixJ family response regulator